jgi:hypothetical protein
MVRRKTDRRNKDGMMRRFSAAHMAVKNYLPKFPSRQAQGRLLGFIPK